MEKVRGPSVNSDHASGPFFSEPPKMVPHLVLLPLPQTYPHHVPRAILPDSTTPFSATLFLIHFAHHHSRDGWELSIWKRGEREREREACVVVDKWFGPLIWWAHISPKQNIDIVGPTKLVAPPPSPHAFSEEWSIFKGRPDSPDGQIKRKRGLFYFVRPLTGFSLSRRALLLFKWMFSFVHVPRITVVVAVAFWFQRDVAFSLILFY